MKEKVGFLIPAFREGCHRLKAACRRGMSEVRSGAAALNPHFSGSRRRRLAPLSAAGVQAVLSACKQGGTTEHVNLRPFRDGDFFIFSLLRGKTGETTPPNGGRKGMVNHEGKTGGQIGRAHV